MTVPDEKSLTILAVDDEVLVLDFCANELRSAGYTVLAAQSGDEAVRLMGEHQRIDVLFTDIRMPGEIDGWALAEEFQKRFPRSGVIYATGYSPEEPRQVRGSLFFRKPYRISEIIKAIQELSARSTLGRAA